MIETVLAIFLESTVLQTVLAGLLVLIVLLWTFNKFLNTRDQAEWQRAAEEKARNPVVPFRARPGGSTGKLNAYGAVLEAISENRKRFPDYKELPSEVFANRVKDVLRLLHPQSQTEWLWGHDIDALNAAAEFVDDLGCAEVADRLRSFAPYQRAARTYHERDQDIPEDAAEEIQYRKDAEWFDGGQPFEQVAAKASAVLERDYPWDQSDGAE